MATTHVLCDARATSHLQPVHHRIQFVHPPPHDAQYHQQLGASDTGSDDDDDAGDGDGSDDSGGKEGSKLAAVGASKQHVDIRAAGAQLDGPPPALRDVPSQATPYAASAEDDSVRCRRSGICDGQYDCAPPSPGSSNAGGGTRGDPLACVTEAPARQAAVRDAAQRSWRAYRSACWGHDELAPLSGRCDRWFNMSLTMVDGLDTMMLMGLAPEVLEARRWIAQVFVAGGPGLWWVGEEGVG